MDKNKLEELLKSILNSTLSIDENMTIERQDSDVIKDLPHTKKLEVKSKFFSYDLNDTKKTDYSFTVEIHRVMYNYWFKNWSDDRSYYLTKVRINRRDSYGRYSLVDELYFDSEINSLEDQSKIWHFLNDRDEIRQKKKSNKKIDTYLSEIQKMTSKTVDRDQKLDKLLK